MADPEVIQPMRSNRNESFTVHQLLHGYDEGHRLLATSLPLSRDASRKTGYLSDLSGPTFVKNFEGYLTAYSLPDYPAYALAKTWSAPEMSRPGCVWTHTLILDEALVARIASLSDILLLFSRPKNGEFQHYNQPLKYSPSRAPNQSTNVGESSIQATRLSLWKLFGPNPEPVLLEAKDAQQWEHLFFAIWALGWPKLRMNLSFCTGLLSSRSAKDSLFDMQAAPPTVFREIIREAKTKFPELGSTQTAENLPEWVSVAALQTREGSALPAFLSAVADRGTDRTCFALLTQVYSLLLRGRNDSAVPLELLSILAKGFPAPDEGVQLKSLLLAETSTSNIETGVSEPELLEALATTTHEKCFSQVDLHLYERGERLWARDRESARKLLLDLFKAPINALGEYVLRGLIFGLSEPEALKVAKTDPDLMVAAVRVNPLLAIHTSLWSAFEGRQRYLLDALSEAKQNLTNEQTDQIIDALLKMGTDELPRPIVKLFGQRAVNSVLDWVQLHHGRLSMGWNEALAQHTDLLLNWLSANSGKNDWVALLLGHLVDSCSPKLIKQGTSIWSAAANKINLLPTEEAKRRFHVFLLAFALENPQPSPERLAEVSFASVHDALEHSKVDYDSWQNLERKLPKLGWAHSWDRCERLRRGLIEAFVRFHWPVTALARCTPQRSLRKSLRKSAREVSGGKETFERAMDQVEND